MSSITKPRVYWRPEEREDYDPDDSCWAVQVGSCSMGIGSWAEAFRYAHLTAAMEAAS